MVVVMTTSPSHAHADLCFCFAAPVPDASPPTHSTPHGSFIHSLGLMHCDIKVRTFLFSSRVRIYIYIYIYIEKAIAHDFEPPLTTKQTHNKQPENIVIKSYSRVEIKIIDFGSSCFTTDHLTSYIQVRFTRPDIHKVCDEMSTGQYTHSHRSTHTPYIISPGATARPR